MRPAVVLRPEATTDQTSSYLISYPHLEQRKGLRSSWSGDPLTIMGNPSIPTLTSSYVLWGLFLCWLQNRFIQLDTIPYLLVYWSLLFYNNS